MREVNFEVKSREELYAKLAEYKYDEHDETSVESEYALVSYKEDDNVVVVPVYFGIFEDAYFESPCVLYQNEFEGSAEEYIRQYVDEIYNPDCGKDMLDKIYQYELSLVRDNVHYDIENFQCIPYLPMPCKIIRFMNDVEVMQYILDNE